MTRVGRLKGRGAGGDAEADPVALFSCRERDGAKGKNMHRIAIPAHTSCAHFQQSAHVINFEHISCKTYQQGQKRKIR